MNSDSTSTTMNSDTNKMMLSSSDTTNMAMAGDDAKDFSKDAAQGGMVEIKLSNMLMKIDGR